MTVDKKHSPRCFIDIEIDGEKAGRIIMELFTDVCPITCENFRALCTGEKGLGKTTDKPLHYKGAPFHRVVKNFVIQGGDFVAGNGTGGESIYGGQFKDENFDIPHDKPFLLSMSNRGKDSNGSQFFITTQAAPHLNGKHTVFGQVIDGQEVVTKIENIKTDQSCRPTKEVKISSCGELVLKLPQKERKRHVSTESSDSESEEERLRRKRKHKHSKKHKKEKKEVKESNTSRKEEDSGCMVDPEEIPTIPTNNFLMRRTSPVGDRNRRPAQRESYSYGRPVISRSGRKIKGRGFMRYRTPSRSTSRSGSETPPHWKQAQSRLRNIKDVVLPKKEIVQQEDSESQPEEMEEPNSRGNVLHSRLGMVSKSTEDQKQQKDARLIMRENRRNREWSPEESPPRSGPRGTASGSPLRSTVVVTSNFHKDSEPDRFRRNDWRGERRGRSPERRPFERFNDNDSNRNRRQVSDSRPSRKEPERPQRSEKDIIKSFRVLAGDLSRYRKDARSDESEERDQDKSKEVQTKGKDQKEDQGKEREEGKGSKPKEGRHEKAPKDQEKKFKSLKSELFRYRKDMASSSGSSSEEGEKQEVKTDKAPEKVSKSSQKKDTTKKSLKSLESELFKYRKDRSDYSSDESSSGKQPAHKKKGSVLPDISEENTATSNGIEALKDSVALPETVRVTVASKRIVIPGIEDSDSNEASLNAESYSQIFVATETPQPVSRKEMEGSKIPDQLNANDGGSKGKVLPVVKEKRRWDMQEMETRKKASDSVPNVFHTAILTSAMPDVIPLPEEVRSVKGSTEDTETPSVPEDTPVTESAAHNKTPQAASNRSRSRSPVAKMERNRSESPRKSGKHSSREHEKKEEPDQKHSTEQSDATQTKKKEPHRSRSRSPKTSSSKTRDRTPSKSPVRHSPIRRKTSVSPEPRTKKLRSKSPGPRRARQSRSPAPRRARPSKSRSRSRSKDRIRRRRSRSPLNVRTRRSISRDRMSRFRRFGNRSPDRRGGFQRRYGKSPSIRGRLGGRSGARRTRSRSPVRRRKGRRSSSSSGSSSSGSSSSRSDRRKKRLAKGRKRSSSSSSSSRSKKSDSDSASP